MLQNYYIKRVSIMSENIDELKKIIFELTSENVNLKKKIKKQKTNDILFHEYICDWLDIHKNKVKENSYMSYKSLIYKHIVPYFKSREIKLNEITPQILEKYYQFKLKENLSANTISKHHANIHSALKYAVKNGFIISNPADYVDKPKVCKYNANYLSAEQLNNVIKMFENSKIYVPVLLSATLGLRRSEVLGLKWDAIDFKKKTIHIRHTAVKILVNNSYKILFSDITKTESSNRLLPLPDKIIDVLKELKDKQKENYIRNKKRYSKDNLKYVCVDEFGHLISPDNLSNRFRTITKKNGYNVRFHDLRHSCASILAESGLQIKDISEWLGHSDITVTSDIYVHLFFQKKIQISDKINSLINI